MKAEQISEEMNYSTYRVMTDALLAEDKTTGDNHSEAMIGYTKMNVARMKRLDKHLELNPEFSQILKSLRAPQKWLVITEPWCGDASQLVPVFEKAAQASNGAIEHLIILRDLHPEIMDKYLTNGGKSIPKLIAYDSKTGEELFNWGPRPAEAQTLFEEMRAEKLPFEQLSAKLHKWYAIDKAQSVQKELGELILASQK
ncbi:MAG: thioredoxin family protein [Balneolales bacterium]|nr:thioredoxin family protein [Balneolales bacterium]